MVVFDKFLIMKSIEESVLSYARIRPLESITDENGGSSAGNLQLRINDQGLKKSDSRTIEDATQGY
jgi:hypothetical protein